MRNILPGVVVLIPGVVAFLSGIWYGEDLDAPLDALVTHAFLSILLAAVVTAIYRFKFPLAFAAGGALLFLAGAGYWVGEEIATDAFNSCVRRRAELRIALLQHKIRTRRYPESLAELNLAIPGDRFLRGSILVYNRSGDGFALRFKDWLVTHATTHESEWHVSK